MSLSSEYVVVPEAPTVIDYRRLRADSGLTPISQAQAEQARENSWYWVSVMHKPSGEVVAMGRIIGDGGWYFHIADMATLPAHQQRGLGRAVLEALLARIDDVAPADPYITLMADAPGRPLYERMGFVPTAPRSVGMKLVR